jgi:hypothetical protein
MPQPGHDHECEEYSDACGCDSRLALNLRIAVLETALRNCIAATGEYTVSECNEVRRIANAALTPPEPKP